MFRILYVSHTHPPEGAILENAGGMQRVSRQLIDELHRCDDVHVEEETLNVSGAGLVALKTTGFLLKSLYGLPKKARKTDADIILFSSMVTAALAPFIRSRLDIPMVAINHGRDVTLDVGIYQKFLPGVFDALDGVISVSRATREECIKRGMDPEKGVALPNGFNLETMDNLPEKKPSRAFIQQEFSIPFEDKKMLLTVGRMVKRKGHEWFIREVLPEVSAEVIYVTVGDGPEQKSIKQAVGETGQQDRIFLLGRQPDSVLKQAYAAADLFIMPNIPVEGDMEGFGIVLLEANLAKTPAIASNLEGIKDVVSNGNNGFKVSPLNAIEFADMVESVLGGDIESLANSSRRYVEEQFAWKKVARDYISYLQDVAGRYSVSSSQKIC
jgi:phosphatidylinositol alpha-1,6-mannosyltransferase